MPFSTLKKTTNTIRKHHRFFLRVIVLDAVLFLFSMWVLSLIMMQALEVTAQMLSVMTNAVGPDAFAQILASQSEVERLSIEALKWLSLFAVAAVAFFIASFGSTSYMISSRVGKSKGYVKYLGQFSVISLLLFASAIAISLIVANMAYSISVSGVYAYHVAVFISLSLVFTGVIYVFAIANVMIPKKSVIELIRSAFLFGFSKSKRKMALFLVLLTIFLAIIFAFKQAYAWDVFAGTFLFIFLFFPYLAFFRVYMIESVDGKR